MIRARAFSSAGEKAPPSVARPSIVGSGRCHGWLAVRRPADRAAGDCARSFLERRRRSGRVGERGPRMTGSSVATPPSTSRHCNRGASRTHESQRGWRAAPMRRAMRPATTRPCRMRSRPISTTTASAAAIDTRARPPCVRSPRRARRAACRPGRRRPAVAQRQREQPRQRQHGRRGQRCATASLVVGRAATRRPADQADDQWTGAADRRVQEHRPAGLSGKSTPASRPARATRSAAISQPPGGAQRIRNWTICSGLNDRRERRPARLRPSTRSRACRCDRHPWGSLAAARATLAARRGSAVRPRDASVIRGLPVAAVDDLVGVRASRV